MRQFLDQLHVDFATHKKWIKYSDVLKEGVLNQAIAMTSDFTTGIKDISPFNFDTVADLCLDNGQAWRNWSDEKAALVSEFLAGYFYTVAEIHNHFVYNLPFDQTTFKPSLSRYEKALSQTVSL